MLSDLPDTPCFLNGGFMRLRDARVSAVARGFIFVDGVYEELRRIARGDVLAADERLRTFPTKTVLPVTRLDNRAVGTGRPGAISPRMHAAYQGAKTRQLTRDSAWT